MFILLLLCWWSIGKIIVTFPLLVIFMILVFMYSVTLWVMVLVASLMRIEAFSFPLNLVGITLIVVKICCPLPLRSMNEWLYDCLAQFLMLVVDCKPLLFYFIILTLTRLLWYHYGSACPPTTFFDIKALIL